MKKEHRLQLITALILTSILSLGCTAAELLEVGQYHQDEVKVKSRLTWLGLFPQANVYILKPVPVKINTVYDPVENEPGGRKTGQQVSVAGAIEPLFLVRGIAGLKPGHVETCDISNGKPLLIGTTLKLKIGRNNTTLSARGIQKDRMVNEYSVTIESNGIKQIILKEKQLDLISEDNGPKLLWAGDLDRDGKLDFLIDTTYHYNMRRPTLFLSSKAKPGQLVQEVASITSVGC